MFEPPSTKMLLNHLDWYEIWTTKTRFVCATFTTKIIVIQKNLDWHENFTTITRLLRGTKHNKCYWKWTFDEKDTSPWSCNHQNVVWWTQIETVNFEWLSNDHYILDWSENFTTKTKLVCATFSMSFIKFGH